MVLKMKHLQYVVNYVLYIRVVRSKTMLQEYIPSIHTKDLARCYCILSENALKIPVQFLANIFNNWDMKIYKTCSAETNHNS